MAQTDARRSGLALANAALVALEVPLAIGTAYLAALAAAARRQPADQPPPAALAAAEAVVLVPAHDEEASIAKTIDGLVAGKGHPANPVEVIVIADNCGDATVANARASGATVWERHDASRQGKGHALAWALDRLWSERPRVSYVIFVDADCEASINLVAALVARLAAGADAVQARYSVSNVDTAAAALRFAAFSVFNGLRPQGKAGLGLSCGLFGSGMAFSRSTLQAVPWESLGLSEDVEQHLRLVASGRRVTFAPEGGVISPMPGTLKAGRRQELRWEAGKLALIREWAPGLIRSGLVSRDLNLVHAGLELCLPPQSLLAAGHLTSLVLARSLRSRVGTLTATAGMTMQGLVVLEALRTVRAPLRVYVALLAAPALIARKLVAYAQILVGKGPATWERTERL